MGREEGVGVGREEGVGRGEGVGCIEAEDYKGSMYIRGSPRESPSVQVQFTDNLLSNLHCPQNY